MYQYSNGVVSRRVFSRSGIQGLHVNHGSSCLGRLRRHRHPARVLLRRNRFWFSFVTGPTRPWLSAPVVCLYAAANATPIPFSEYSQ